MKKFFYICFICLLPSLIFAEQIPLRVAIPAFSPPFVMRTTTQKFYGFDIATIEYVCEKLQRPCEYFPMDFENLIPAVLEKKTDVAIGSITITAQRSRLVRFSTPYMLSRAQFIGNDEIEIQVPIQASQLSGKKIGVLKGSIYAQTIQSMKIDKPRIIFFQQEDEMIYALNAHRIDLALLDIAIAQYWESRTGNAFKMIGNSFPTGFGLGIIMHPDNGRLMKDIDFILFEYVNGPAFKKNYDMYIKR